MRAITSVKQIIQGYITANTERGKTGKNVQRDTLFTTLMSDIAVKETDATLNLPSQKLEAILALLEATEEQNNALDGSGKEHAGESTIAIHRAQRILNKEIPVALKAEAREIQAALKAEAADLAKRQADAQRHKDAAALITNPIAKIRHAIAEKRVGDLDPTVIIPEVERVVGEKHSDASRVLTNENKAFYRELKTEFFNRQLPVSEGIFYLLMHSPLAKRYEDLLKAHAETKDKASARALRTMIENVGEIINICLKNQQNALQDLQALLTVKSEIALRNLLTVMQGRAVLTVVSQEPLSNPEDLTAYRFIQHASGILSEMQPDAVARLDVQKIHANLDGLKRSSRGGSAMGSSDGAAAARPAEVQAVSDILSKTLSKLHHYVSLSVVFANLIEELEVSTESVIGGIESLGADASSDEMRAAGALLAPEYRFLASLKRKMNELQETIQSLFVGVHDLEKRQKDEQITQTDLVYNEAFGKLSTSVARWNTDYAILASDKQATLTALGNDFSDNPEEGERVAVALTRIADVERAETALKREIATHITAVQDALVGFKTSHIGLPVPEVVRVRPTDALSLSFIAGLANTYADGKKDVEKMILLVDMLHKNRLLTPSVQARLHQSQNVSGLLALHLFLNNSGISVNQKQLKRLWNALDQNTPDFSLLGSLQTRFGLNADAVITLVENLSGTWDRSLKMLTKIYGDENATPDTFMTLINASKGDNDLIEKVYLIYQAIKENQPEMIGSFFILEFMSKLIKAIKEQEQRFTNEMVMRLTFAPILGRHETIEYVLDRTVQMLERNLSYHHSLEKHAKHAADEKPLFDEGLSMLLSGFHELARYDGAHQVNVRPAQTVELGKPAILDTAPAQWSEAKASVKTTVVDLNRLDRDMARDHADNMSVNPEQRMYLRLMELAMNMVRNSGLLVVDSVDHPTMAMHVNANREVMDTYLFYVLAGLKEKVVELGAAGLRGIDEAGIATAVVTEAQERVDAELHCGARVARGSALFTAQPVRSRLSSNDGSLLSSADDLGRHDSQPPARAATPV